MAPACAPLPPWQASGPAIGRQKPCATGRIWVEGAGKVSNSDSFIDEVSEEVRKDRLFGLLKRYGWIAAAAVFALVGGAAYNEYTKAQARTEAQQLGDAMLSALERPAPGDRAAALDGIETDSAGSAALLSLLTAGQQVEAGDPQAATARLEAVATNPDLAPIYRQIASYKALLASAGTLDVATRRAGFTALAVPGNPLRLLAEEQLALIDLETGDRAAALERLRRIAQDSELTAGLRVRVGQIIAALGGTGPDV